MSSNDRLFSMTSTFKCEPMEGSNSNEEDSLNTLSTDNGSNSMAVCAKIENRGSKRTSSFKNPKGLCFGYDDCSYPTTQSPILTQHRKIAHKVV